MNIIFTIYLVGSIFGCVNSNSIPEYNEGLNSFKKFYKNKTIINHFPKKIKLIRNFYCYSLSRDVDFAEIYLSVNSNIKDIELIKKNRYKFIGEFKSDNLFQVNVDLIRDSSETYASKVDFAHDLIPIGNIEQFDFGLGQQNDTIYTNNQNKYNVINKYVLPEDLKIYVIDANSGDFFVNDVFRVKRYSQLRKWKNGFSRGIAISEKYKIIMYWLITW